MSWLRWQSWTIGSLDDDFRLGDGVKGLGGGQHRTSNVERTTGGHHGGRMARSSLTIEADAWTDDVDRLRLLAASMQERPNPLDELPLAWSGLGWGDVPVCAFVRPLAFDHTADVDGDGDDPVHGLRLQWQASDPTIYSADPVVAEREPGPSHTVAWTNPGLILPPVGLGGRAWTVHVRAVSGSAHTPRFRRPAVGRFPEQAVEVDVSIPSGHVLTVDHHRQVWLNGRLVTGRARTPGDRGLDWPMFPPGISSQLIVSAAWGQIEVKVELRGTW